MLTFDRLYRQLCPQLSSPSQHFPRTTSRFTQIMLSLFKVNFKVSPFCNFCIWWMFLWRKYSNTEMMSCKFLYVLKQKRSFLLFSTLTKVMFSCNFPRYMRPLEEFKNSFIFTSSTWDPHGIRTYSLFSFRSPSHED